MNQEPAQGLGPGDYDAAMRSLGELRFCLPGWAFGQGSLFFASSGGCRGSAKMLKPAAKVVVTVATVDAEVEVPDHL